jgi:cytochrome c
MTRAVLITFITVSSFLLGGCGQRDTDAVSGTEGAPLTAATLGEQNILSPSDYLAQDRYAGADTGRGEILSMQCRACHTLEKGGAHLLGPNLFGLFGRTAGSAPDFSYSDALAAGGFVWTPRALDAWLAQPFAFLPGNRMSYPGLPDGNDRTAVIAYLLQYTDSGAGEEM